MTSRITVRRDQRNGQSGARCERVAGGPRAKQRARDAGCRRRSWREQALIESALAAVGDHLDVGVRVG